jgi:uncharacterized protein (TIGR03083 family)
MRVALERNWLLATAREEREATGRTIQYTEPERWDHPSGCEGWSNRDVVAHLASTDTIAAATMAGEALSEVEEYFATLTDGGAPTVDGFNDFAVKRRAGQSVRAVISEWGGSADTFLARCAAVPKDEWNDKRVYWIAGQMRVPYLLQSRVMEWWLHGEDVRAGAELPPRRVHKAIYCVNDLAIRSIPYALSLAGLSFSGKTVQVTLEGPGEGTWVYGLAAREVPPAGVAPDTLIEGGAYPFALIAGHRLPPDRALEEGSVQVGGDVALGETVLRNLRAFA